MSKWFPEVDDHEGAEAALRGGFYASLGFAAMLVLGIVVLELAGALPAPGHPIQNSVGAVAGIFVELVLVLIAAWRFKIGKGVVWGPIILVLFAVEIATKLMSGGYGVAWLFFYAAIAAGLVNGVRGAWAKRHLPPADDYAEVFE